jgi:hypothetical protein
MKRSSRQLIFFTLLFLLFFLGVKTGKLWSKSGKAPSEDVTYIVVGVAYTCVMLAVYYLAKLDCNHNNEQEGFWDVSPAAKCKGGKYMWQGSSPDAVRCREIADSPQGRAMIASYNCPKGFIGLPKTPFQYTALSDDNWQDGRTADSPDIELTDTGSLATQTAQLQN